MVRHSPECVEWGFSEVHVDYSLEVCATHSSAGCYAVPVTERGAEGVRCQTSAPPEKGREGYEEGRS